MTMLWYWLLRISVYTPRVVLLLFTLVRALFVQCVVTNTRFITVHSDESKRHWVFSDRRVICINFFQTRFGEQCGREEWTSEPAVEEKSHEWHLQNICGYSHRTCTSSCQPVFQNAWRAVFWGSPVAEELLAVDDCRGRCGKGGKGTHKLIGHNLFTSNAFLLSAHLLLSTILVRIRRNGFHYGVFICLCHCILLIFVSSPFHTFSIKKIWSREIKQKSCLYAVSVSWTLSL